MVLAFFIECGCPPGQREATVSGGGMTVADFLASHQLNRIECQRCGAYYRLIGHIDEAGVERMLAPPARPSPATRRRRLASVRRHVRI